MRFSNQKFSFFILLLLSIPLFLMAQDEVIDQKKAERLLTIAQERDRVAAEALEEVKSRRIRLEEDLLDAEDNPNVMPKTERKKLDTEVKLLKTREKELVQKRQFANNLLLDVTEILKATAKKRTKFISDYEAVYGLVDLNKPIGQDPFINSMPISPIAVSNASTSEPPAAAEKAKPENKKSESKKSKPKRNEPKPQTEVATEKALPAPTELTPTTTEQVLLPMPPISEPRTSEPITVNGERNKKNSKKQQPKRTDSKPVRTGKSPQTEVGSATTDAPSDYPVTPQTVDIKPVVELTKTEPTKTKKENTAATRSRPTAVQAPVFINYRDYSVKEDVLMNPPAARDCQLVFDGIDSFTGKKKEETAPIMLFAHTDDFMRAAMAEGKEYVSCDISATRVEGARFVYLNLTITIQTKDAQRSFGFLDRNSPIILKLINGKRLTYATTKTDIGTVDVEKNTTTFRIQIAVTDPNDLLQSELDAVRIAWSAGYEDYEIYDMAILENLVNCLNKAKP